MRLWWFPKIRFYRDKTQSCVYVWPRRLTVINPKGEYKQYFYRNKNKKETDDIDRR